MWRERDPFNIPVPIRKMAVFRGLSGEALFSLAAEMQERLFTTGQTIIEEGSTGDHIYVVGTGAAQVVKRAGTDLEVVLARLEPGQFFGEMGLIEDEKRSATVRACEEETAVFSLGRRHLDRIAVESPGHYGTVVCNIGREIATRIAALEAVAASLGLPILRAATPGSWNGWDGLYLFKNMAIEAVHALMVAARDVTLKRGQACFNAAAHADGIWVVREGRLELLPADEESGAPIDIFPGDIVGETCVIEDRPHERTLRASENSMVQWLSLPILRKFAARWPIDNNQMILNIARNLSKKIRNLDAWVAKHAAKEE